MTHITCRLTAKIRDQLRNPTLGNRVLATFTSDKDDSYTGRGGATRRDLRLRHCSRVEQLSRSLTPTDLQLKCRIYVLNRCINTKRKLYATSLLPNFQVHRHLTDDAP